MATPLDFSDLVPATEAEPAADSTLDFSDLVPQSQGKGFWGAVYENVVGSGEIDTFGERLGAGFQDVARGLGAAPVSLVQGVVELGSSMLDASLGTSTTDDVTETFESAKGAMGLVPKGGAGKAAEGIAAFGLGFVPVVGWLNRANAAAKGLQVISKSKYLRTAEEFGRSAAGRAMLGTRAKLIGTTAAAYGGYGVMFSPDGRASFSDSVSWMPDALKTRETEGLEGRERALAVLANKLRLGVEDGLFSLGFDAALAGAGAGVRALAEPASEVLRAAKKTQAAQSAMAALETVGKAPGIKGAKDFFVRHITPSGGVSPEIRAEAREVGFKVSGAKAQSAQLVRELQAEMVKFAKEAGVMGRRGKLPSKVESDLTDYLNGSGDLTGYSERTKKIADRILSLRSRQADDVMFELEETVNSISRRGVSPGATPRFLDEERRMKAAREALNIFRSNEASQQNMMRRMFERHERPEQFYANLELGGKLFNDAVDEVARRTFSASDPKTARELATKVVYDSLGLNGVNGESPEAVLKDILDGFRSLTPPSGVILKTERAPLVRIADNLFIERKKPIEDSPALRALLGEIRDPLEVAQRTISDLAQTAASLKYYRQLSRGGFVDDLFTAFDKINQGGRPSLIRVPDPTKMSPKEYAAALQPFDDIAQVRNMQNPNNPITANDVLNEYIKRLNDKGWTQLSSKGTGTRISGGPFGEITGMYASPEVYRGITAPAELAQNIGTEFLAVFNQARASTQRATVTLNPPSRVRDALGSFGMLVGSGNFSRDMDFAGHAQLAFASLLDLDEMGLMRLRDKLEIAGIRDTQPFLNIIEKLRKEGVDVTKAGGLRQVSQAMQALENMPVIKQFSEVFEDIASGTDMLMKTAALASEEQNLRSIFSSAGISAADEDIFQALADSGLLSRSRSQTLTGTGQSPFGLDLVETAAAETVRDVLPNYTMVGTGIKELLERVPFGNFTSFAAETIRTSLRIVDRGMRELAFEFPPEMAAKINQTYGAGAAEKFQRAMHARGAQRLASYIGVAGIMPKATVHAGMAMTNTTPEQMEAVHQYADDYLKGRNLVPISNDQDGRVEVVNIDQVAPYAFAFEGAQAALQRYAEMGRMDKSEIEQIGSAILRGLSVYAEPFGSESIVYEHLRDVLPKAEIGSFGVGRGGETVTKRRIWNEADPWHEKVMKGFGHMYEAFKPGFLDPFFQVKEGIVKPGNLMRAATDYPGPRGQAMEVPEELAKIATGITPIELNLRRDFSFRGQEYGKARGALRTTANRIIRAPDATKGQMLGAWQSYIDQAFRLQSQLYADIEAARTLGVDDRIIRYNLINKANLGTKEVNTIMQGKFYTPDVSSDAAKDVRREILEGYSNRLVSQPPFDQMFRMSRERSNEELAPLRYRLDDVRDSLTPSGGVSFDDLLPGPQGSLSEPSSMRQGAAMPPPATLPASAPAPQGASAPTMTASLSPDLLGDNPFEQAANMAIAQRLSD